MAAALWVALRYGSPGDGHPLSIPATLGSLVSRGGLSEVRRHQMGGQGPQPWLSPEAASQASAAVATGRFRTAWQIRDWMVQQYEASYTLGGVYSLLKRLKCSPKVPRPVHVKADLELQAAWKKGVSSRPWPEREQVKQPP